MPFKEGDGKVIYYTCGSYGVPEARFYQSDLCDAHQELVASQAEVERLRGSLRDQERSLGTSQFYLARAIEIAEIVGWTQNVAYLSELRAELDQLKATLNP